MTNKRLLEIETEAQRRLDLWLANTTFDSMTCNGSYKLFCMRLGLFSGSNAEKWMSKDDWKPFVSFYEWDSLEYDIIMSKLYDSCTQ